MTDAVLVIEDEPQIRQALSHVLGSEFERVLEAGTAADGIALAASAHPALVILDIGLPGATP